MIAREQVEAVLAECTDSTVIRRRVADALLALIAAQPVQQPVAVVGQEPTLIAYAATDLDGRVDVGLTPEIAKKRAGHGCDTVFRLYDIGNTVPAAGVQGDKQTDLARRLLFKANDTNGNQISIMKADLIAICCEANRYYIGMVNWKATAEAKDLPSQPDSGRDAALVEALTEMVSWFGRYPEFVPAPEALDRVKASIIKARAALAAHPTPSSDAGLAVAVLRDSLQSARDDFARILSNVETGTVHRICAKQMQSIHADLVKALRLAAHPANGARVGLSDEQRRDIELAAATCETFAIGTCGATLRAILAAAKKGT